MRYLRSPSKELNWLPIPQSGLVNVTLRVYDPNEEAKSTEYKIPPLKRVDCIGALSLSGMRQGRYGVLQNNPK